MPSWKVTHPGAENMTLAVMGCVVNGPGESRHVPTGRIHRYEAIERTELLEVSTPELDDVIRLEDDFGREGTSAP